LLTEKPGHDEREVKRKKGRGHCSGSLASKKEVGEV